MFEGVRTLVATMVMQPNPQKRSELDVGGCGGHHQVREVVRRFDETLEPGADLLGTLRLAVLGLPVRSDQGEHVHLRGTKVGGYIGRLVFSRRLAERVEALREELLALA